MLQHKSWYQRDASLVQLIALTGASGKKKVLCWGLFADVEGSRLTLHVQTPEVNIVKPTAPPVTQPGCDYMCNVEGMLESKCVLRGGGGQMGAGGGRGGLLCYAEMH